MQLTSRTTNESDNSDRMNTPSKKRRKGYNLCKWKASQKPIKDSPAVWWDSCSAVQSQDDVCWLPHPSNIIITLLLDHKDLLPVQHLALGAWKMRSQEMPLINKSIGGILSLIVRMLHYCCTSLRKISICILSALLILHLRQHNKINVSLNGMLSLMEMWHSIFRHHRAKVI